MMMNKCFALMLAVAITTFAGLPAFGMEDEDNLPHPSCADFNKNGIVEIEDFFHVFDNYYFETLFDLDNNGAIDAQDGLIFQCLIGESYMLGDYNDDGTVNTADLLILLANYGTLNGCIDLTGNGKVQQDDLVLFLEAYFGN